MTYQVFTQFFRADKIFYKNFETTFLNMQDITTSRFLMIFNSFNSSKTFHSNKYILYVK